MRTTARYISDKRFMFNSEKGACTRIIWVIDHMESKNECNESGESIKI